MGPHDRVLLISNSTVYGRGYLDHVESEIKSFLGRAQRVLFFPFALHDRDAYTATARARFNAMDYSLDLGERLPKDRILILPWPSAPGITN